MNICTTKNNYVVISSEVNQMSETGLASEHQGASRSYYLLSYSHMLLTTNIDQGDSGGNCIFLFPVYNLVTNRFSWITCFKLLGKLINLPLVQYNKESLKFANCFCWFSSKPAISKLYYWESDNWLQKHDCCTRGTILFHIYQGYNTQSE